MLHLLRRNSEPGTVIAQIDALGGLTLGLQTRIGNVYVNHKAARITGSASAPSRR